MGQRYKKCPFLKILSALIMKSIIAFFFIFAINNIDKNLLCVVIKGLKNVNVS